MPTSTTLSEYSKHWGRAKPLFFLAKRYATMNEACVLLRPQREIKHIAYSLNWILLGRRAEKL